jgi:hypothetical protein
MSAGASALTHLLCQPGESRYILCVSTSPPEEIRAAAEIHRELGPEYQDAVVESFVERVGREIDARVESRLAAAQQAAQPARQQKTLALPITSIALGIPLRGIALGLGSSN